MKWLLATHLLCTVGMFGVIWVVQLVHYPLFSRAERSTFVAFEADHSRRITWVVGPLMIGEIVTAGVLAVRLSGTETAAWWWVGLAMVLLLWASTAVLSIPQHSALGGGWNEAAHRRLVLTNWPRTVLWTARSLLVIDATLRAVERGDLGSAPP